MAKKMKLSLLQWLGIVFILGALISAIAHYLR